MRRWWTLVGLIACDTILICSAYIFAFWLRLGWDGVVSQSTDVIQTLPIILLISLYVHMRLGLFNAILRYASVDTAIAVLKSVVIAVGLSCVVLFLCFRMDGIPRTVFVIYGMTILLLVGASRLAVRFRRGIFRSTGQSKRVVLIGAEDTTDLVLRGLLSSNQLHFVPLGVVDEKPENHGRKMHGVPIYASLEEFTRVRREAIDECWICRADLVGEPLRHIYKTARIANASVKILPRLDRTLLGEDLQRFHEPDITDLLRRPPRRLDHRRMKDWIGGRGVLITGAGGSIGSELARKILGLGPARLALCDSSEPSLFKIHHELATSKDSCVLDPFLLDVRDAAAVTRMFLQARPEVVFHAAAYKHVPMVEINACEGILTNVGGLINVATAARDSGVGEFVFISTDKAVRPANVMGATKRLGEEIIQTLNRAGPTRFMAVRFGNVLGSSGSVIPIFQEQIKKGGPVTVTHREMTRFFMLIQEAVDLVIQSGSIGRGGEIFILDMGAPIRIADMAEDMIRLMGKEPGRDIEIAVTGCRPGEKIHEELLLSSKDAQTEFPDIWIDHEPHPTRPWADFARDLGTLCETARIGGKPGALIQLKGLVPRFEPVFESTKLCLGTGGKTDAAMTAESRFSPSSATAVPSPSIPAPQSSS